MRRLAAPRVSTKIFSRLAAARALIGLLLVMHLEVALKVSVGQHSEAGIKENNEDSMGIFVPREPALLTHKGVAAVIADGVSAADAGREAAETSVQNFLNDYFSTPESWTVETSATKVISALNSWLFSRSAGFRDVQKGYVCTLSVLILKSRLAYVFHVGDTRVYLIRNGQVRQLTRDHAIPIADKSTYLSRAMGLDTKLDIDFQTIALEEGDTFLLTSDGVHDYLESATLAAVTANGQELEDECRRLLREAIAAGSPDNVTAQLVRVDALPDASAHEYLLKLTELPFPPELSVGSVIDGFVVEKELHASRRSQLYLVREPETGRALVMKTPSVNYEDDPAYIERFILEHWIGSRVKSRHLLRSVDPPERRSCLYSLRSYVEGVTVEEWIRQQSLQKSDLRDLNIVTDIVGQCVRGLMALHRKEILHQDLKPGNIVVGSDGVVKIIDFGSCSVAGVDEIAAPIVRDKILGTASYAAPEYTIGLVPTNSSDLYSLGCIAYEMLTGKHPYGEAADTAKSAADFDSLVYTPAYELNPHVPLWIDGALRRAVAVRPQERYSELSEFMYDLENPNPDFVVQRAVPLLRRRGTFPWKRLALLLLFTQALTLWLWLRH